MKYAVILMMSERWLQAEFPSRNVLAAVDALFSYVHIAGANATCQTHKQGEITSHNHATVAGLTHCNLEYAKHQAHTYMSCAVNVHTYSHLTTN